PARAPLGAWSSSTARREAGSRLAFVWSRVRAVLPARRAVACPRSAGGGARAPRQCHRSARAYRRRIGSARSSGLLEASVISAVASVPLWIVAGGPADDVHR